MNIISQFSLSQVFETSLEVLTNSKVWTKSFCSMNFFFVADGSAVKAHTSRLFNDRLLEDDIAPFWNFDSKIVILSTAYNILQELANSYAIKRSRNVVYANLSTNKRLKLYTTYPQKIGLSLIGYFESFLRSNDRKIFERKFDNLQGAELSLSSFSHPPSAYLVADETGNITEFLGVDVMAVQTLSEVLNFKINLKIVDNAYKWGKQLANGTWKGIIGDLVNGDSDIGVANIFIEERRQTFIDFSSPIDTTKACFIAPGPKPLPRFSSPIRPFSPYAWLSLAGFVTFAPLVLYFVSQLSAREESNAYKSLAFDYVYILRMLSMQSPNILPKQTPLKIYQGFLWLCVMLVTIMYSANLISFLSIVSKTPPIKTIRQVGESDYSVLASYFFTLQLKKSLDQDIVNLVNRVETMNYLSSALEEVVDGKSITVENRDYLDLYSAVYIKRGDKSALRMVDECINPYSITIALQKYSPYKKSFDKFVTRIIEAGVMKLWKDEVITKFTKNSAKDVQTTKSEESKNQQPLTIDHIQGIFVAYFIGLTLSFIIFLFEIVTHKVTNNEEMT